MNEPEARNNALAGLNLEIQSDDEMWNLTLFVAGQTPKSLAAYANLKKICEEHLRGKYSIEVVDLMVHPELAQQHDILAIPTLIRKIPSPMRRIIGDLSNTEKALVGMDLRPRKD